MTKKKEKVSKKKEDPYIKYAEPRDLTIESWSTDMDKAVKDNIEVVWKYRIKPAVIDVPASVRIYEPPMKDPILNMLCYMMTGKDLDDL